MRRGCMPYSVSSMRHGIDDVSDAQPMGLRGHIFRVRRRVGPLPGVAVILVEGDRHHDAALVVIDAAPVRNFSVVSLVSQTLIDGDGAGHLYSPVKIVE